ncbi:MAG: nucleotide sugar dehydrogenase, partial [Acidobacteriota bacterium]
MHIAVIGTGYVGLVTGACFAEFGVDVTCVDVDDSKIDRLNNGIIPIYEPGLDQVVEKNVRSGRLHFTTEIASAVAGAQVVFLAVGTPPKDDGTPDMSFYQQAAKDIAGSMNGYKVLVTKSTVPVGTGKWLREFVSANLATQTEFGVASNPEFLREGAAIEDFMRPDRVVIGSNEMRA